MIKISWGNVIGFLMCLVMVGIDVGHQFFSRAEMVVVGFHQHWLNGINYIGKTATNKIGKALVSWTSPRSLMILCFWIMWVYLERWQSYETFWNWVFYDIDHMWRLKALEQGSQMYNYSYIFPQQDFDMMNLAVNSPNH